MPKTRTLEQARTQLESEMRARRDTGVLAVEARAESEESGEIEFSFSSETPVERWFGSEILGHGPTDKVNTQRFLETGSVLMFHDTKLPVAEPLKAWVDATTRKGRVRARFDMTDPESQKYFGKVRKRLIKGVSVGYSVEKYEVTSVDEDGYPTAVRATEWTVLEVSIVTVPADATVGIGRSLNQETTPGISRGANSRHGDNAMFKLKDGREVSLSELDALRMAGDVTLADGTVLARQIPASVVSLFGTKPAPETRGAASPEPTKAPLVENADDLARRQKELARTERQGQIENFIDLGEKAGVLSKNHANAYRMDTRDIEEIRKEIHAKILAGAPSDENKPVVGARDGKGPGTITVGDDKAVTSLREAIPHAILMRCGALADNGISRLTGKEFRDVDGTPIKVHERANGLRGLSIVDMAREYSEAHGVSTRGKSPKEILVDVMGNNQRSVLNTSGSFSTLLENAMHKLLYISYEGQPTTWQEFCDVIPAKDLRSHPLYKKGVFGSLARVGDGGEVQAATYPDGKKEVIQPAEFSRTFALTEKMLINDDLGAFSNIVSEMGSAAAFTVEDWVYYTLLSNPTLLETGGALFNGTATTTSGGHNNLTTGANAPSETTYQVMIAKMSKQVAPNGSGLGKGRVLNLMPTIALGPTEVSATLAKLYKDQYKLGGTNNESNAYQGLARPVVNARLALGVTVDVEGGVPLTAAGSTTAYYLLCSPGVLPTIAVAFLNGSQTPDFAEDRPIDVLGRVYRVTHRFGVAAADFRGAQKHNGA